ncbi:hypothetical protein [Paenibacillus hubeiensis]
MITLLSFLDVLKGLAALLSILLSAHKLYRWFRRKFRQKKKPTA